MAQEQALNTGSGNNNNNPPNYGDQSAPEFVGGSSDASTGTIIPSSVAQADRAPPPKAPSTRLGSLATAPKATGGLAPVAGSYLGSTLGGSVGSLVGQGVPLSSAISITAKNAGSVLQFGGPPSAPLGSTSGVPYAGASGASDTAASIDSGTLTSPASDTAAGGFGAEFGGALGAGAGAGLFTAGIGALSGQQPKTYVPEAAASAVGTGAGYAIGTALIPFIGPAAPFIGGAIGGTIASSLHPVETFFSHLFSF